MTAYHHRGKDKSMPEKAKKQVVFIDTETYAIEPGKLAPRMVCIAYYYDGQTVILLRDHAKEWITEVLHMATEGAVIIVGHNIAFDMGVIASAFPDLLPLIFLAYNNDGIDDTMLREQLIDIANGTYHQRKRYGLAVLADARVGMLLEKDERQMTYALLDNIPIEQWSQGYREYVINDVLATKEIYADQSTTRYNIENSYAQARASYALLLMCIWGIRTDNKAVEALEKHLIQKTNELKKLPEKKGLIIEGKKSVGKIRELVEEAYCGNPPRTDKGSVKYDENTLQQTDKPELVALAELGKASKLLSTYIPMLKGGENAPIHTYYRLVETGRTSSSSPNIQNLPREPGVRECFVPRKGNVYISVDYDTLELRALAQVCLWVVKRSKLAEKLNEGFDPHLSVASQILKISYDEALKRKGEDEIKNARQLAKIANFGFPGGMGCETFPIYARTGYNIDITVEESAKLRENWFAAWPEMIEYFAYVGQLVHPAEGEIIQFISERVRGKVSFTAACNGFFQGLAADGAKAALFDVQTACYCLPQSPLYGCRPVAFIHDEILMEAPRKRASDAAKELVIVMCAAMKRFIPDVVITAEPALMERWTKNAKPQYVGKRLVPWQ